MRLPRLAFCLLLCVLLAACAGAKYTDQPLTSVDLTEQGAGAGVSSRVLAQAGEWRNTGVLVKQGVDYALSTNGRWRAWPGCKWTDADGLGMYTGLCLDLGGTIIKGWTHQALIARIGETGSPFAVGKAFRFTAPADGLLYLHINEQDHGVWDNEGYVDVSVSLAGPLAPGLAPGLALVPAPAQLAAQAQAVPQPAAPQSAAPRAKKAASSAGPGAGAAPSVLASQPMPQPMPQSIPQSAPQPQAESVPAYQPPAHQIHGKPPLRRVALVIGNGAYPSAPLRNPVNDARDMAATLRGLGFEVILRENASLRQMEDAVDELWKRLKAGGAGLFFFAGHGLQVAGRNYLVPVDARLAAEQDVKYRCMDAGLVLGRMENAGNQLNIVILDACRNNPYSRNFRSVNEGLAKMDAPRGSIVAYATAPDSVAADGAGKNGVYTGQLLKHMRTPGLPIEEMFKRVRIGVLGETQEKQVPWEASSLTGDFSFKELPR
ncbi:MAG: caspase family protein [Humidesulfovibrio sp.]